MAESFVCGGHEVASGTRQQLELPVARLPTGGMLALQLTVLHGARPGPKLWLSAALHGDELNGLEIIRRVVRAIDPAQLGGTLVAIPIVNVFGLIHQTRYLPDRRDLNRCFPGSRSGSLASRLAHLFVTEVVDRCDCGIDFHTGSLHRTNLSQIRANLDVPEVRRLAEAFAAPLRMHSATRRGSLRAIADRKSKPLLVFEGGEPLRFNRQAIQHGVLGTRRVLHALGMWPDGPPPSAETLELDKTSWLRAQRSGVFYVETALGDRVRHHEPVGTLADPISGAERRVRAPWAGVVIGHTNNPLVYRGDAVVHLGHLAG